MGGIVDQVLGRVGFIRYLIADQDTSETGNLREIFKIS